MLVRFLPILSCFAVLIACSPSTSTEARPDAAGPDSALTDGSAVTDDSGSDAGRCSPASLRAVDTTRKCLLPDANFGLICIDTPRAGKGVYVVCAFVDHKMFAGGSISPPVHAGTSAVTFAPVETARTLALPEASDVDDAECRAMPFSPTGSPLPDCR